MRESRLQLKLKKLLNLVMFGSFIFCTGQVLADNLTSTANMGVDVNNQLWNQSLRGGNRISSPSVSYSNCYALVQRCANPKCKNGGCTDSSVAKSIVNGCLSSLTGNNSSCSQHSGLVDAMAASLVANSTAVANQNTSANSDEQIQQLTNQIQQLSAQTAQAQQQMAQELANAQAAASQAQAQTQTQQVEEKTENPMADDLLARQQISGQILTKLENVQTSLAATKKALNAFFDYAGCNSQGENCKGPKRVAAMKDKAEQVLDPYDDTRRAVYNAMLTAQSAGINIDDIYRMLSNSCVRYGLYKEYKEKKDDNGDPVKQLIRFISATDEEEDAIFAPEKYMENLSCTSKDTCDFTVVLECATDNINTKNNFFSGLSVNDNDILSIDNLRNILNADYTETRDYRDSDMIKQCKGNSSALKTFLKKSTSRLNSLDQQSGNGNCNSQLKNIECNDLINPNLAICTNHAFNIGMEKIEGKK